MTTPAAWTETCLAPPSIFLAMSIISLTSLSFLYISANSGVMLQSLVYGHRKSLRAKRYHFGNSVAEFIGFAQGAGDVSDRASGHHGAESADLGDMVFAVFSFSVYSKISSLRSSAKSISMSGGEGR